MKVADFDYELPEDLIAQEPLADRSASRLLVLHKESGKIEHRKFVDVLDYFRPGDLLAMNDTRVTAVRLYGRRPTGASVEALLLSKSVDGTYIALLRPAKRLKEGARIDFDGGLVATVVGDAGGGRRQLRFIGGEVEAAISRFGLVPLPPYVKQPIAVAERYQTVYGRVAGSAAAPTAGLHFTNELLQKIATLGVETCTVTLDVGLDTFRPVSSETTEEHVMHGEVCRVSKEAALKVGDCKGRVIAVGTTTARTLESFAQGPRSLREGETATDLFITPGYRFQVVDALLTNFHMPRTTMLMMVAALAGREPLFEAYRQAVVENYRFLSFGDAMLIV